MEVKEIKNKIKVSRIDLVRMQIITEFIFFRKEQLIPTDIDVLVLLAIDQPVELGRFCNKSTRVLYPDIEAEEFAIRSQNIRNRISKLEKRGVVKKDGTSKKMISINDKISLYTKGDLLLTYNFLSFEADIIK